jgi:hypothetical protein
MDVDGFAAGLSRLYDDFTRSGPAAAGFDGWWHGMAVPARSVTRGRN